MIYFLEHDAEGNIYHTACYPVATIVPLINVAEVKAKDGTSIPLAEPVGIDAATYNTLISEGLQNYIFNAASGTIVKKEATSDAHSTT